MSKLPQNQFKIRRAIIIFSFLLIVCAPPNFAATLAQYRENVQTTQELTLELLYPEDEEIPAAEYPAFESETLSKMRRSLPPTEKVEWRQTVIETDNQWFDDKLADWEKEAEDSPRREQILTEIYERLGAIELKLKELENAPAQNRAKDGDKHRLAEILRRAEYQKPEAGGESIFHKIIRQIKQWLAGLFPHPTLPQSSAGGFQSFSFVLQILLYILILGVIGFLIYRFAPFFADRFRRKVKKEKKERVILGERLAADETAQNLFSEAEKLAREGNLRGAIRKGYIALLCDLSDRKIIDLAQHKTNRDYLRGVRQKRQLYKDMTGLTSNFERHWYGFESAQPTDWEEFRQNYQKVINS